MKQQTVAEARAHFYTALPRKGSTCPVCDRRGKLQPTPISKAMTHAFAWLVRASVIGLDQQHQHCNWIEVQRFAPDFVKTSNSHAKLLHWELLERKPNEDPAKKHSGVYRPTQKGLDWYQGRITVPKYAHLYNRRCFQLSGKEMAFKDLFDPFHYQNLIRLESEKVT